ncbi:TonB-dependent siderophore receptor [Pseudomonas sp. M47T1]|uniref:TonB-dependent receptor n=1 Tax=Pseudomonas sp. M47T1 TaxID=1179778 RepID=UPI000260827C|nr:TonB-dependent siderophore receptor [Pseudomonas sp. M47T1]EIK97806.1 TonB-dependent siderophore receptor [Pseudomonas sp. M47T1]
MAHQRLFLARPLGGLALMSCSWAALGEGAPVQLEHLRVEGERERRYKAERSASHKLTEPLLDVPQTVTVVGEQIIREQNALSVRRILSNVSGITFDAGEGNGGSGDLINIRGFNASSNVQLDGLRDSAQTSRSDSFNLQAVEVLKGPNSVFGGAGTTGGTINLISKAPQADAFTELGLGLGTDHYRRLTLDTNQPLTEVGTGSAVRLNLMAHENDVPGRPHIDRERWGLAPSLLLGLGEDTRLTLSYFHQQDNGLPDYGLPTHQGKVIDGVKRSSYFGWRNLDKDRIDTDRFSVAFDHDFSDALSLNTTLRYARVERHAVVSASHVDRDGLPAGKYRPAGPQGFARDIVTDQWLGNTSLTSHFDTFGIGHALVTGVEVSYERYRRDAGNYNIRTLAADHAYDLANPPGYWHGPIKRSPEASMRNRLQNTALYAFDTLSLAPRWDLTLGLSHDWIDGSSLERKPGGTSTEYNTRDAVLSHRAGLVYKPAENGRVYLAYGNSFNPSAESLVSGGYGVTRGTAKAAPETSRSWELGTKWAFLAGDLQLDAALFRVQKDNVREKLATGESLLAGTQRVQGLELGASGRLTSQWQVFANYTYMQSQTLKSATNRAAEGQALANTPPRSFSLWTTYQMPGDWRVGYGLRHASERNLRNDETHKADGYWVHQAMLGYQVSEQLDLQLNLDNLLDTHYVERIRQVTGNGKRSSSIEYGDARSAVLSAVYRF